VHRTGVRLTLFDSGLARIVTQVLGFLKTFRLRPTHSAFVP
jgi:hypothetical protein